jgi:dTDP-glucose 4,6-dehydratase/UDP-glucose 4-epimerase
MRVLVIGSEGFIGSHCIAHFSGKKDIVYGVDLFEQPSAGYRYIKTARFLPDFEEILQHGFDAIINCAGNGNVPYSMTHPVVDFESNCLDTIRILEAIRRLAPTCKYLHLSSAAVYGNPVSLPVEESDEARPLSPYGWHKVIAENLCREYATIFKLSIAIARPFSVYGPGLKKQMFWDWYQRAKASNGSLELLGTGKESRDYIYVKDLVLALDLILQKGELKAEVYNLASGRETTIDAAANMFFSGIGFPVHYTYNGIVREGDPLNWRADVRKLTDIGFACRYDMASGFSELHKWLKNF